MSTHQATPVSTPGKERAADPARRTTHGLRAAIERASGILVWLAFVLVFALWIPGTFLTSTTAQAIAGDQAITLIVAIGVLFTLVAGQFDLSIAQNVGVSAVVVSALMVKSGLGLAPAIVLTLGMGAVIGAVNGFVVAWIGVSSFIATLAMSSILLAMTSIVSGQNYIGPVPDAFQNITSWQPLGIPSVTIYAVVIALLSWYALEHTPVGRRMHATGANPEAARLAGVPTRQCIFGGFVVAGIFGSLGGILVASKLGSVSPDLGPAYLLPAFAACFLGATQIKPNRFNVWGTVLALYLLATGVKGLQLAGGQPWITDLFNGVALLGAVVVAVLAQKRRDARLRAASDRAAAADGA